MPITPFRERIFEPGNTPSWGRDGTSERLFYSFGLLEDARMERLVQGIMCRLPRSTIANNYQAPADALVQIGADRGPIVQGPTESAAAYALRLQQAPNEWQIWGGPRSVLDQVCAFFAPYQVTARLVTDSGHWYTMQSPGVTSAGVTITANAYTVLPPTARPPAIASNWSWDGNVRWWRAWLIVHLPVGFEAVADAFVWDSGPAWDAGWLWDGVPQGTLAQLVAIAQQWYPEHAQPGGLISGIIVTTLQPTDVIPGQAVRPFDPGSVNTTNADHSTNLPVGNWGSPVYTSGPYSGFNARPPWATFYDISNA